MGSYIENPKTKGSGLFGCIPQAGRCPLECPECFFQHGRSYLEPLEKNLPNCPPPLSMERRVVHMNDGADSNVEKEKVVRQAGKYEMAFFNTSLPNLDFPGPVVLTVNPRELTDKTFYQLDEIPPNLMYVRVLVNTWNLGVVREAVQFYTKNKDESKRRAVVLTFMAYHDLKYHPDLSNPFCYMLRKRTLNSYYAITTAKWRDIMREFEDNILVYSCGRIEGEMGSTHCKYCGNCLREYFATAERIEAAGHDLNKDWGLLQ